MLDDLPRLAEKVKEENKNRVAFFCGIIKRLRLITLQGNIEAYSAAETNDAENAYDALEKLQVAWRRNQIKFITQKLEEKNYMIGSAEEMSSVLYGKRIEQVSLPLRTRAIY